MHQFSSMKPLIQSNTEPKPIGAELHLSQLSTKCSCSNIPGPDFFCGFAVCTQLPLLFGHFLLTPDMHQHLENMPK